MNAIRMVVLAFLGGGLAATMGDDGHFLFGAVTGVLAGIIWGLAERVNALERQAAARAVPARAAEPIAPVAKPASGPVRTAPTPAPAPVPVPARAPASSDEELFPLELPAEYRGRPTPTPAPQGEDWTVRMRNVLFGGNPVLRAGLVVLFFGVAFLFKFAAEHQMFPVELRYLGVVAGALALLTVGWRQRGLRSGFSLLAQGGAVGVLYITVFAAMRLHGLVPAPLAFALLVALVALSGLLAVLQDARGLAVAGALGGFLAPILVSTGSGNHVALFSYYALLNAGVLGVAWYRSWRALNLVGFIFTFGIAGLWGWFSYRSDLFATTEPFLILFFVMYVAIAVLRATFRAADRDPQAKDGEYVRRWRTSFGGGYVDGTLVFGLPAIVFGLQAGLVREIEFGLAWSALGMALVYTGLAVALWRSAGEGLRLLVEAFLALGVVFGSLAIPLALEGRWTASAWALEGAALVWIGVRQHRLAARLFGLLLQAGAGLFFIGVLVDMPEAGELAVLNGRFLGGLCLAIGGLVSAWQLRRKDQLRAAEEPLEALLTGWGLVWWFGAALTEVGRHLPDHRLHGWLGVIALSALAMSEGARRLAWRTLALPLVATAFVFLFLLVIDLSAGHPFRDFGYVAWPVALFSLYAMLRRQEGTLPARALGMQHGAGLWLFALLLSAEGAWALAHLAQVGAAWRLAAWNAVPVATALLVIRLTPRIAWPLGAFRREYASEAPLPLLAISVLWCLVTALTSEGNPAPLGYLPLLNPLEMGQVFVLLGLLRWRLLGVAPAALPMRVADAVIGVCAFAVLNGVLARAVHFYTGVSFDWDALLESTELQTAFAVAWTLLALVLTVAAARLGLRTLWLMGAALLAVVVAKLFLVDLANSNTIARIVSFMGVGALMLAIGFFAPLPPVRQEREA